MRTIKQWALQRLREEYPKGTRVELIHMDDPYNRKLVPGCKGTVLFVKVAVGWLPGVGNIVNATTAITVTEALGWMLAEDFAKQASKSKVEAQTVV